VLEEMLFRGVILRAFLRRYPAGIAIVHSSAIFGLAHLNLYQFLVGLMLGLLLGWLYERTRSLWPCIALHGAYNSAVTFLPPSSRADEGGLLVLLWVGAGVGAVAWLGRTLGWPGGRRSG
jgi:membrane protease YdiL (CAAX protease family)